MALSWFSSKPSHVAELIAKKKYDKAAEVLREQLATRKGDALLTMQLADVLVKGGVHGEAVLLLMDLADSLVRANAPARAISVLKRLQAIQPGRPDIDGRLAHLIKEQAELRAMKEDDHFPARHLEELDLGIDSSMSEEAPSSPQPLSEPQGIGFFSGFSESELVAVMAGLELRRHGAGDIILTEGEPGTSLFVLTRGAVRAWVVDQSGRNRAVRDMAEGEFFGEIALLNGSPRTATITALCDAELLELDRSTLDAILEKHPKVIDVLHKFNAERHGSAVEAASRLEGGVDPRTF